MLKNKFIVKFLSAFFVLDDTRLDKKFTDSGAITALNNSLI